MDWNYCDIEKKKKFIRVYLTSVQSSNVYPIQKHVRKEFKNMLHHYDDDKARILIKYIRSSNGHKRSNNNN